MLKLGAGGFVVIALFVVMHGMYLGFTNQIAQGAFEFSDLAGGLTIFVALITGTFTGVVSSILVMNVGENGKTFRESVDRRSVVLACALSPVVMGSFYDKVAAIESGWVIFLLAHQNGFFWENISTRVRVGSSK